MTKPKYKSGFEVKVAKSLHQQKVAFEYEAQKFPFVQPAKKRAYTPDFILPEVGISVECKGKLTKAERDKLLWVKEQWPELNLILLFMRARNFIRKGSKTRYSDWAEKNGFEWYSWDTGGIPPERLKKK